MIGEHINRWVTTLTGLIEQHGNSTSRTALIVSSTCMMGSYLGMKSNGMIRVDVLFMQSSFTINGFIDQ